MLLQVGRSAGQPERNCLEEECLAKASNQNTCKVKYGAQMVGFTVPLEDCGLRNVEDLLRGLCCLWGSK